MKRLVAFLLITLCPASVVALPTVSEVMCRVRYFNADASLGRGAYEKKTCLVKLGFTDPAPDFRLFACTVPKGEFTCTLSPEQIQGINNEIQTRGQSPGISADFAVESAFMLERTDLEKELGCIAGGSTITIDPEASSKLLGLNKCEENSTCSVSTTRDYRCAKFRSTQFDTCQDEYDQCRRLNTTHRVNYSVCSGNILPVPEEIDFDGNLTLCQLHLEACNLHNSMLFNATSACKNP